MTNYGPNRFFFLNNKNAGPLNLPSCLYYKEQKSA